MEITTPQKRNNQSFGCVRLLSCGRHKPALHCARIKKHAISCGLPWAHPWSWEPRCSTITGSWGLSPMSHAALLQRRRRVSLLPFAFGFNREPLRFLATHMGKNLDSLMFGWWLRTPFSRLLFSVCLHELIPPVESK